MRSDPQNYFRGSTSCFPFHLYKRGIPPEDIPGDWDVLYRLISCQCRITFDPASKHMTSCILRIHVHSTYRHQAWIDASAWVAAHRSWWAGSNPISSPIAAHNLVSAFIMSSRPTCWLHMSKIIVCCAICRSRSRKHDHRKGILTSLKLVCSKWSFSASAHIFWERGCEWTAWPKITTYATRSLRPVYENILHSLPDFPQESHSYFYFALIEFLF
jgi:hypothetical protein